MRRSLSLAAIALSAMSTIALAAEPGPADKTDAGSLQQKAKESTTKGAPDAAPPAAKPMDSSLSDKAMETTAPGTGTTATAPTAQPKDGSLDTKAKETLKQ